MILTCAKCGERNQISVQKLSARSRPPLCDFCDTKLGVPEVLPEPDFASRRALQFLLICLAAHLPLMLSYCRRLWTFEHYQFYPFAIGATAVLLFDRIRRDAVVITRFAWTVLAMDGLLLAGGCLLGSPWMGAAGFAFGLTALVMSTVDFRNDRRAWAIVLPYLSMLRPPAGYDVQLIQKLQHLTSRLSSELLDRLELLHLRSGNTIKLQGIQLFVEDACSGVQSLFAVLFVTTLIIAFRRRSPLHALLLIAAGIFCAIPMNVARIVTIAMVWDGWQLDWSQGTAHSVLGYVLLCIAAILTLSADRLIRIIGGSVLGWEDTIPTEGFANPHLLLWNRLWCPIRPTILQGTQPKQRRLVQAGTLLLAVGLCGWQCVTLFAARSSITVPEPGQLADFELPKQQGPFTVSERETIERSSSNSQGQYSETWQLRRGDLQVVFSCDFPFTGWHDLETCYAGVGWRRQESRIVGDDWPAIETTFTRPTGERAFLVYSLFDSAGTPVRPRSAADPVGTLSERFKRTRWKGSAWQTYQCQVFVEGIVATDPNVRQAVKAVHDQARERIRRHLAGAAE